jgi:hypothetical protein
MEQIKEFIEQCQEREFWCLISIMTILMVGCYALLYKIIKDNQI